MKVIKMKERDAEMMRESREQSTILVTTVSQATEENRTTITTKLRRVNLSVPLKITHNSSISLGTFVFYEE